MTNIEIKRFSDLLVDHLKTGSKVSSINIEKMPPAGVGSVMVKVEVTTKAKNDTEEKLYVVAKLVPAGEITKKIFEIEHTFKNEVAFYKTIVPTLQKFQKQQGVAKVLDCFAKFCGARLSLDKNEVDDDAVLVLENLAVAGFQNIPKHEGFDLEAAKLVLRDLAKFQGTAISLKLKQPEVFNEKIKTTCRNFNFNNKMPMFKELIKGILKQNPDCAHLADKMGEWPCEIPEPREPYASIAHGDLWVNNTMQKFENGKIVANKFVDFQVYSYRSCASDVFFFLWTSCQDSVVQNHLDYLLKHYHDSLVNTLKELQCDTNEFSFDKFLKELQLESVYEFGHTAMFMVLVKSDMPIPEDGFKDGPPPIEIIMSLMPSKLKEYFCFMFQECDKRGWLH